jgi:type I restriction-modification system DNA methylase subunit
MVSIKFGKIYRRVSHYNTNSGFTYCITFISNFIYFLKNTYALKKTNMILKDIALRPPTFISNISQYNAQLFIETQGETKLMPPCSVSIRVMFMSSDHEHN